MISALRRGSSSVWSTPLCRKIARFGDVGSSPSTTARLLRTGSRRQAGGLVRATGPIQRPRPLVQPVRQCSFLPSGEESYRSYCSDYWRCLVPAYQYPDGRKADVVEKPRDEVHLHRKDGSAFLSPGGETNDQKPGAGVQHHRRRSFEGRWYFCRKRSTTPEYRKEEVATIVGEVNEEPLS